MVFAFCVTMAITSSAQTFNTLATFDGNNGSQPLSSLIQGTDGNFYGTTSSGGNLNACDGSGCGTIFKMTPDGTLTTVFSFSGTDGVAPQSVVQGSDGYLYGTTFCSLGGFHRATLPGKAPLICPGGGIVFKVSTSGTLVTLHSFTGPDGDSISPGLIQGNDGNFYGTTTGGGTDNWGTVFKITPGGTLTTLHSFAGPDGSGPYGGLVQGSDGNFYGTTGQGGNPVCKAGYGCGTVFKITPNGVLTLLHSFTGPDGIRPLGGLVQATDGNFYGTTTGGGAHNDCSNQDCGTIFRITPSGTLTTLYNFAGPDGAEPHASLLQATDGNLYGTTDSGGQGNAGTAFRFTTSGTLTTLYRFCSLTDCADGSVPDGALLQGTSGPFYGTTSTGGDSTCDAPAGCGTIFSLSGLSPTPNQFVPLVPCRLVDTRSGNGGGPIQGGTFAIFNLPQLSQSQSCGDLSAATAYSLNVTLVPQNHAPVSYLKIWPTGTAQPAVSTMNSLDGRIKANAAIVPAGASGAVDVFLANTADVVIDIDGYFAPPSAQTLQFYPLPPCRVADTRLSRYPQGLGTPHLSQAVARDFPVLESVCIPLNVNAVAYSFNLTAIPYPALGNPLAYLEVWPTGQQPQHPVSTLNNPTGTYVANAAIVSAGNGGSITALASDNTDLAIDINGYFAAPGTGGLSLYPTVPCRVIDTRKIGSGQPFSGSLTPPVDVVDSGCGVPSTAAGYVFNATVVPSPSLSYLTLWPDGQNQPVASTLNAADGWITSNMAIVPSTNGSVDAYAAGVTQLILDISAYFAPGP